MPLVIEKSPTHIVGIVALTCLNAGLIMWGLMISGETTPIDDQVVERRWIAPLLVAPIASTLTIPAASQDDPTLIRPIFFASRQPFEPPLQKATPPPPTARPPPSDPTFLVDGIVLTVKSRRAYLRPLAEAEGRWHETGQVIDGWTVAEIERTGIVLEQADRRFSIPLYQTHQPAFKKERRTNSRFKSLR